MALWPEASQHALYNPFDPGMRADPYPTYRRLREREPVHQSPLGFWALSRYGDIVAAQHDPRFRRFSDRATKLMRRAASVEADGPTGVIARRWLLLADATGHRRFRSTMGRCFNKRSLERLRSRIRGLVDELLDDLETSPGGQADLMTQFARPLPVSVACELLGMLADERERARAWSSAISAIEEVGLNPRRLRRLAESVVDCEAHLRDALVRNRRGHGQPQNLLSELELRESGVEDDEQVMHLTLAFFGAAYETTVSFLGNAILALLQNPEQADLLRRRPELAAPAIEELLRFDTSVHYHGRWTSEEVALGDRRIPAGSRVLLLIAAANRDPARFSSPDRLDLLRPDVRPLSFGGGQHVCLGASLARLEAELALGGLLRRFPRLTLAEQRINWRPEPPALRAPESLPVSLHGRGRT